MTRRRRTTCTHCGRTVVLAGAWPDERYRPHTDPRTGDECAVVGFYLDELEDVE